MNDQNQHNADQRTQERDKVITNMNGQIGVLGLQVTDLTTSVATLSARVGQPFQPLQVTVKQLSPASPRPTPLSLDQKTDTELVDYEHAFAEKLRALEKQQDDQIRQLQFSMPPPSSDPQERNRLWQQQANMLTQVYSNYNAEYRNQFWADALALRDEFKRRYEKAGKVMPTGVERFGPLRPPLALQGAVAGPYPLSELAEYFDLLAKEMPTH